MVPTDSANVSVIESSHNDLKEYVLPMKERGQALLLSHFNMSGNRLISFLHQAELVVCNSCEFTMEPQWTRGGHFLKQNSIIDYTVADSNFLQVSGSVQGQVRAAISTDRPHLCKF